MSKNIHAVISAAVVTGGVIAVISIVKRLCRRDTKGQKNHDDQ